MKKFKVRPCEAFELEFSDGTTIPMCFNMKALSHLGELINNNKITTEAPSFYSAIIYAGCKAMNDDFTEEEANALYVTLSESHPDAMTGIFEEYCDAAGLDQESLKKNAMMMLMSQKKSKKV